MLCRSSNKQRGFCNLRKIRHQAGPKALGKFLNKSTRATLVRRGFAHADLLSKWTSIVGPTLARHSSPERLNFSRHKNRDASLKVRVSPGFAPEFQQFEPMIVERINSFFGYRAVGRLQLVQAPVKLPKINEIWVPKEATAEQKEQAKKWAAAVEDDELRHNLERLGAALLTKQQKPDTN
jgi:hypothetical protein